jgi:hypothetical protein
MQDELDKIKFEMLLHGVERSEVDKLNLDGDNSEKRIPTLEELRLFGIGGDGSRFKKRK